VRLLKFLLIVCLLPAPAWAQLKGAEPEKQVHWASAAFFGTGWYRVDENRRTFIFRIPWRQEVRSAGWDEDGERKLGIEIIYPVSLGVHSLDELPDFIEFDNYGTITFTPGVAVEIPLTDRWDLRPYAHYGVGYEDTSGEWAQIYYGGINSRYLLNQRDGLDWNLLNAVSYAGYKPEYKNRGHYGSAMAGIEAKQRMERFNIAGTPAWLNWHVTYDYMFDNLNFHVSEDEVVTIRDQWEFGLALSRGDRKIKIWFLQFEQLGLAYKISSNGKYRALSFNLRSRFED
jgi:hypothetical protein